MFKDRIQAVAPLNPYARIMSTLDRDEQELANLEQMNQALIVHIRTKLARTERFTCKRTKFLRF